MRLFLIVFLISAGLHSLAQSKGVRLREDSIVKDSAGTVYPPEIWKGLLLNGYTIRAVDPSNVNTEFVLQRMSPQQIQEKLEKSPRPRESQFFKTGEKIKPFKTTDIDGHKIDLQDLKGKIVVLNFWFIDCSPCRKEIPELNNLVDSFKSNSQVVFIGIALDNRSGLKDFFRRLPFKYTIIDNGRFIADKYGIRSFPTHVILNPEGEVYFHTSGLAMHTVFWIRKLINELLAKE